MAFTLIVLSLAACASNPPLLPDPHPDGQAAFDYLKGLEGEWVVQGGDEGPFGWDFDVTSRGSVVVERLKVGTPTEMTTVYHLEDTTLVASHYCQLRNQPRLTAVSTDVEGDLHFVCDGSVGNAESHAELHMHGVHFRKEGENLVIWMDMLENGEVAFRTSYTLVRADPR
ncbi:MAG: hypothetical protein ACYTGC_10805 [Planctomycetota bacterium]